tara:strand:+ start:109 stop:450 length:342 start_codon:yes stop_codon:yes gene_type:complete
MNQIPISTLEHLIETCSSREDFIEVEKIIREERNACRRFYMKLMDSSITETNLPNRPITEVSVEEILAWGEQKSVQNFMQNQKQFEKDFEKYEKLLKNCSKCYAKFVREENNG